MCGKCWNVPDRGSLTAAAVEQLTVVVAGIHVPKNKMRGGSRVVVVKGRFFKQPAKKNANLQFLYY